MKPHLDILMVDDDEVDLGLFRQAIARTGLNIGFQPLTTGRDAIDGRSDASFSRLVQTRGRLLYRSHKETDWLRSQDEPR